eukprot:TRINITY_DN29496_c0_g2_i1.p1 TRINITY_DN29496_c0_g2~~TRINITY_DN29496_c0_g2_i1.p1  ORF type:complete len:330 (+),score=36.63 TRINITY_DN29496_c0_g2_i1:101-1090(+)
MTKLKIIDGKYRLRTKLASSSHGFIYKGFDIHTGENVAIKIEPIKNSHLRLVTEAKLCKLLEGSPGIPTVLWYGVEDEYFVAVVDLLGPSLKDLFSYCGYRFSLSTVLMLADQMITRIENVHSKGIVHRDIKPGHFAIGRDANASVVHLIDFGCAKRYLLEDSQKHIPLDEEQIRIQSYRYMSVNAHHGLKQSRKDDLESLCYTLVYFLCGHLPWQRIHGTSPADITAQVLKAKVDTPIHELCRDVPQEIANLCVYSCGLRFDEDPDYDCLRSPLKQLFLREGHLCDSPFDWAVKAHGFDDNMVKLRTSEESLIEASEDPQNESRNDEQ